MERKLTDDLSIGQRIHNLRIQNGLTQAQFSELINISVNFLSEIENNKKGMSQDTLYRLCSSFNVSADYILFGTTKKDTDVISVLLENCNNLTVEQIDILIEYLQSLKKLHQFDS